MNKYNVRFYQLICATDGVGYPAKVGVGVDGRIWVAPGDLGVRQEDIKKPAEYNYSHFEELVSLEENRSYVNAHALIEMLASPEHRKGMREVIDGLEALLKSRNLIPKHVNVRNN